MNILKKRYYCLLILFYTSVAYSADSKQLTSLKQGVQDVAQVATLIQGLNKIETSLGQAIPREYGSFKNETQNALTTILRMFNTNVIARATPNLNNIFDAIERVLEKSLGINNSKFKDPIFKQFIDTKKEEFARIRYNLLAPPPPEPIVIREPYPVPAPQRVVVEPVPEPQVTERVVEKIVEVVSPAMQQELDKLRTAQEAWILKEEDFNKKLNQLKITSEEEASKLKIASEEKLTNLQKAQAELQSKLYESTTAQMGQEQELTKLRETQTILQTELEQLIKEKEKRDKEDQEAMTRSQLIRQRAQKLVNEANERLQKTKGELQQVKDKAHTDFKEDDFSKLSPKIKENILDKNIDQIEYDISGLVGARSLLNVMANIQQDLFGVNVANIAQRIEALQSPTTSSEDVTKLEEEIDVLERENEEFLQQKNEITNQLRALDNKIFEIRVKEKADKEELEKANQEFMSQSLLFTSGAEGKDQEIAELEKSLKAMKAQLDDANKKLQAKEEKL